MGYYLTYCFDNNALDVIFAGVVLFQKIHSASLFYCICNRTVHTANPEHCYFVPFAYFYYEILRNYNVTERFPYQSCSPLKTFWSFRTFLNLLTVVLNPNWLDLNHMLRKLLKHSNSL